MMKQCLGHVIQLYIWFSTATCYADDFVCPLYLGYMCLYAEQKCDGRRLCPTGLDEQSCGELKSRGGISKSFSALFRTKVALKILINLCKILSEEWSST